MQLANDRQHLLVAQNARRSAHLQLLRAMGMRLDTELELTDKLAYVPVDAVTLEQAKAQALKERPGLQGAAGARSQRAAFRQRHRTGAAALGGGFRRLRLHRHGLDNALPTRDYGISVKVPLFDGGRRDARRAESASQYRAEKVRTNDLKEQIELDVRLALDSLRSADDQVKVAKEGLDLADNELTQARRRYEGGRRQQPGSHRRADAPGAGARQPDRRRCTTTTWRASTWRRPWAAHCQEKRFQ